MNHSATTGGGVVGRTFDLLRSLRYVVYIGGLAAVALVTLLGPAWAQTPVVVTALTVMCTTYLAELHSHAQQVRAETLVVAIAVGGIAVGAFVLTEVSSIGGLLFVVGGILFFRAATHTEHD